MKLLLSIFLILAMLINPFALTASAENSTKEFNAFYLKSASVTDGDKNIATDVTIQLNFSEDMTDITVLNDNKNCFYLIDKDNYSVPIRVVFPDTQMDRSYRTQAFITPTEELSSGEEYTLVISNKLMTKKFVSLDKTYKINFSTSTEVVPPTTNTALEYLKDNIMEYEVQNTYSNDITTNATTTAMPNTKPQSEDNTQNIATIAVIAIIVLLAAVTLIRRVKKD